MAQSNVWSKVRSWMGRTSQSDSSSGTLGPSLPALDGTAEGRSVADADGSQTSLLSGKWRRQDPAMEKLQESFGQVVDLMDAMRKHMSEQDAKAGEIATSLAQVAGNLDDLRRGSENRSEILNRIADELKVANDRANRWQEALTDLPGIAQSQRETLSALSQQIEAVGKRDDQLVDSLGNFREAVSSLGDATTASSVAVKELQAAIVDNEERTANLMTEQTKRFTMLFVVTVILAAIVAACGIAVLWRVSG